MSGRQGDRKSVLYDAADGVAVLRINRPEARNSLGDGTEIEVYNTLLQASRDPSVRVLILRGEGDDFCCGADIKQCNSNRTESAQPLEGDTSFFKTPVLLHTMPAITIAAVKGGCAGAGFGWAAACDLRFAAPSAKFNTAFLAVGAAGDMGVPWMLARQVGAARARDLSFFPRKFGADEALAMGFISRILPENAFEADLARLAGELAAAAPLALKALKANYLDSERLDFATFVEAETERHLALFATEDRAEAFAAYLEKRPPRFVGR
ncbi:MAG: enoyl-CoA hydratase/isomerase family protein [Hyphomonadaceae bacterium]